jgi:CheY-like chemotaxis protein/c-di-GMP-binding flagellar brake protein YcgR
MATEEKDLEPFLGVGCAVVFHADPLSKSAPRYTSILRGWRKPSYVLLDRPKLGDRYAAIRDNQPCVIRFVREGRACAFDSMVLDWDTRQYNAYCRVEWPKKVHVVGFRKFERVKLQVPCRIDSGEEQMEGQLQDFSAGGCRLGVPKPIAPGAAIKLSFILPDGCPVDGVRCVVRNMQTVEEKTYLGCEFIEGQVAVESNMAFYITTTLERGSLRPSSAEKILIIDENPAAVIDLRRELQGRGFEVLIATETLDGLSEVRLNPPTALILNQAQPDLPGLNALRLVKMTRGLEKLPVFVYNAEANLVARAEQLGAAGCFPSGLSSAEFADAVATYLITPARLPKQRRPNV